MIEDLRAMGAPDDVIASYSADEAHHTDFEVLADNWDAVQVFVAMATQWRFEVVVVPGGVMSRRVGLDYTALSNVMRWLGIEDIATVFQQVQQMEYAALEELNKA